MRSFKRFIKYLVAVSITATVSPVTTVHANNDFPTKPVHLVLPFPPGGPADTVSRALGERLSKEWKVPVVIENRPGGNSFIATEAVARAKPDGYTLLLAFFGTLVVNPSLYDKLPYDPVKDFVPITTVATLPLMLVVHPDSPIQSIPQLIEMAKAQPKRFTFASGGAGQGAHLAGELLQSMTGIQMVHVPYKGNVPAVTDLLGGHVDMIFDGMTSSLPYVKANRLRPIAVSTEKRAAAMPELPTVAESSLPGFDVGSWFGILAPAGTPEPVVDELNRTMVNIIKSDEFVALLANLGLDAMPSTSEEFSRYMEQETEKWAKVVKDAQIKLN